MKFIKIKNVKLLQYTIEGEINPFVKEYIENSILNEEISGEDMENIESVGAIFSGYNMIEETKKQINEKITNKENIKDNITIEYTAHNINYIFNVEFELAEAKYMLTSFDLSYQGLDDCDILDDIIELINRIKNEPMTFKELEDLDCAFFFADQLEEEIRDKEENPYKDKEDPDILTFGQEFCDLVEITYYFDIIKD